jgi:hypothetical protein
LEQHIVATLPGVQREINEREPSEQCAAFEDMTEIRRRQNQIEKRKCIIDEISKHEDDIGALIQQ